MTVKTKTRERPIMFRGDMVRALLDRRKWQTRRVVKPQPTLSYFHRLSHHDGSIGGMWTNKPKIEGDDTLGETRYCPFGQPGDSLYVQEGVWSYENTGRTKNHQLKWPKFDDESKGRKWFDERCEYEIDNPVPRIPPVGRLNKMFMPPWASRITLEIIDVRVERLHDISGKDAIAEGVTLDEFDYDAFEMTVDPDDIECQVCGGDGFVERQEYYNDYINEDRGDVMACPECWQIKKYRQEGAAPYAFERLWKSMGNSWDDNLWLWVIEFKVKVRQAIGRVA